MSTESMVAAFCESIDTAKVWLKAGDAIAHVALQLADHARWCWSVAGEHCEAAEKAARELAHQIQLDEDEEREFWAVIPPKGD
jgi:hypothetical protein